MSSSTAPSFNIDATFGAILVGMFISAILFGLTSLQTVLYCLNVSKARWIGYKGTACALWCMDGIHLSLVAHTLYFYLVARLGENSGLVRVVWSFKLQIVLRVVVGLTVKLQAVFSSIQTLMIEWIYSLYLLRIQKMYAPELRFTRYLPIFISGLLLAAAVLGIVVCYRTYEAEILQDVLDIKWSTYAMLACAISVNLTIAFALCIFWASRWVGPLRLHTIVVLVILCTLTTGLLTCLCSIAAITACILRPRALFFLAIEDVSTKLYVNSFLAMLNARPYINAHLINNATVSRLSSSATRSPERPPSTLASNWTGKETSTVSAPDHLPPPSPFFARKTLAKRTDCFAALQSDMQSNGWRTSKPVDVDDTISRASSEVISTSVV